MKNFNIWELLLWAHATFFLCLIVYDIYTHQWAFAIMMSMAFYLNFLEKEQVEEISENNNDTDQG